VNVETRMYVFVYELILNNEILKNSLYPANNYSSANTCSNHPIGYRKTVTIERIMPIIDDV